MISFRNRLAQFLLQRLRTARAVARLAYFRYGGRLALIDRRGSLTYRQLEQRVMRLNAWMTANGVKAGDLVFTWLPETGEQYETRLATYENGAIFASYHRHLSPASALATIERLKPALFIHDPALSASILDAARARLPAMRMLAVGKEYEDVLAAHRPERSRAWVGEDDVLSLHMTSGTTGEPKALAYTHRKYLDSVRMIVRAVDVQPPSGSAGVMMLGLPFTGPGSGMVLPTLLTGAALVMPEDFRPRTLAEAIQRHRVTRAFLSPSAIVDLLDEPTLDSYNLSSLAHILYGSEMMPAAKIAEAIRRFGPIFQQGYGCFEALPPLAWLLPHEHVDLLGHPVNPSILSSVGRVVPGVDIVIRDESFAPVSGTEVGLITVRTPVCFDGYWGDPDKTRETLRDGWVAMGDIGYFDADGYLHVLGRSADRVVKDDQILNPREIEEVVHCHWAVKEACLVQHGKRAVLVVSLRARCRQGIDREELARQIEDEIRPFIEPARRPDEVRIVDEIPRSFLNKMLRREVRAMLAAGAGAVVDRDRGDGA